jgi:Gluconate 2-dehydrogenase subunit 3
MTEERFKSLYPDYDVLHKWQTTSWNEQTRRVVAKRLTDIPPRQFFTELQWLTLDAVCHRVIPQPERAEPVPIAPWIDAKLYKGEGSGTRYAGLPRDRECWRRGMDAIEAEAQHRHRRSYHALDPVEQDLILRAMNDQEVEAPNWTNLPSKKFMRHMLLREIVAIYYAHPAAWSEIGFGGPASPRGYVRMGFNRRDPWEAEEERTKSLRKLARP